MPDDCEVYHVVHPITKEVVSKVGRSFKRVADRHPYRNWFAMNINALSIMETCKRVDDFRVWIALSCRMDKNNAVDFTNLELARALGMTDSQVCTALNRLRANGIVVTTKCNGRKTHRLAEGLQWKGKNKDFPSNYTPIGSSQKYDPDAKWDRKSALA